MEYMDSEHTDGETCLPASEQDVVQSHGKNNEGTGRRTDKILALLDPHEGKNASEPEEILYCKE